jgi:hypothetical protein
VPGTTSGVRVRLRGLANQPEAVVSLPGARGRRPALQLGRPGLRCGLRSPGGRRGRVATPAARRLLAPVRGVTGRLLAWSPQPAGSADRGGGVPLYSTTRATVQPIWPEVVRLCGCATPEGSPSPHLLTRRGGLPWSPSEATDPPNLCRAFSRVTFLFPGLLGFGALVDDKVALHHCALYAFVAPQTAWLWVNPSPAEDWSWSMRPDSEKDCWDRYSLALR